MPRAAGLISAGGIIAPVIPPSIGFVVFGVAAGVSITRLFLAGIVPGILMGLALLITWWIVARDEPVARAKRASLREIAGDTPVDGIWALVLPGLIVGGMKAGVFTPTEAAVVAAVYAGLRRLPSSMASSSFRASAPGPAERASRRPPR